MILSCDYINILRIFFDVLLTVHLGMFTSVINQLDAHNFCFTTSLFHASTCFEHMCSSSGGQNCITHQEVKIALHSLWYHHTYRCDDTRGCVMQFWPPDDEHMCSKHVEAWNKLIVKQKLRASSWLITEINILRSYITFTESHDRIIRWIPMHFTWWTTHLWKYWQLY